MNYIQTKELDDKMLKLLNEKKSARDFQLHKHEDWNENYELYRNKVKTNRLTQRQAVNIPLMKETIKTLISKSDDAPNVDWKEKSGDQMKELIYQEIWDNNFKHNKIEWLESFHSFSFASYFNPQAMNYSHLRVINEDKIKPGTGFGFHPHKNMEIITFMLDGQIQHKDNMGNVGILKKGNAQLMRAGTGIIHSEMNPFDKTAYLLQIWINSNENNLKPGWWEKEFSGQNSVELIVEPIDKQNQISSLSEDIQGSGLKMARNGYIIKVSKETVLNFENFGSSEVYIHQGLGSVKMENNEQKIELAHGDAAMGTLNSKLIIKPQENAITLVFVFPE